MQTVIFNIDTPILQGKKGKSISLTFNPHIIIYNLEAVGKTHVPFDKLMALSKLDPST